MDEEQKEKLGYLYQMLKNWLNTMPKHGVKFTYVESPTYYDDCSYRNIEVSNSDGSATLKTELCENCIDITISRISNNTNVIFQIFFDEESINEITSIYNVYRNQDVFLLGDNNGYDALKQRIYSRLMCI